MERGLLWLPLLVVFIWLASAGWNEYKKVEAYQSWAVNFDRHKYDIYAVLGQKGDLLTWGIPTRSEPKNIQTVALSTIKEIKLEVDDKSYQNWIEVSDLKSANKIAIALKPSDSDQIFKIPFTDLAIALNWFKFLSSRHY